MEIKMNDRIRELAAQAYSYASGQTGEFTPEFLGYYDKKFAELLVRECAKKGFDIFNEEPDAPASDLQFYVRDGIKKHFGVE